MNNIVRGDLFILILLGLSLVSCLDTEVDSSDPIGNFKVVYLNPNEEPDERVADAFKVAAVIPEEGVWKVIVSYSGGCQDHNFLVWWDGVSPKEGESANVYLIHEGNEDECEALVSDTIEIAQNLIYDDDYFDKPWPTTIINLSQSQKIQTNPELSVRTASRCGVPIKFQSLDCATGLWGNQWLMPTDTAGVLTDYLFQPIESDLEGFPNFQETKAGVQLYYGFRPSVIAGTNMCDVQTDRNIVAVKVTCLQ